MKRGFLNRAPAAKNESNAALTSFQSREMFVNPAIIRNEPAIKLSYGNIDAASKLPTDHDAGEYKCEEHDGNRIDYDENMIIMTTQPAQNLNTKLEDVPGAWTECVMSGTAKRMIVSTPGFPRDPPKPAQANLYRIAESPGKGMGMFANKAIRAGELIVAERAIILAPAAMEVAHNCPSHFTDEQVRQATLAQREKMMEVLFSRVRPERKAAYMSLFNSHLNDGSGPLMGIMRTNGFGITLQPELGLRGLYTGVFDDLSRVNHSCSPNTTRRWDLKSFSMQLFAVRNIEKNEEFTAEYCGLLERATDRQKELAPYGVKCVCRACRMPKASDPRRLELGKFQRMSAQVIQLWAANPILPEGVLLNPILECLDLVRKEGLEGTEPHRSALMSGLFFYAAIGDEAKVAEFGEQAQLYDRTSNDDERLFPDNVDMVRWLKQKGVWAIRKRKSAAR